MQTVYQPANGIEAQIVVDVLAGHGIEARVHGAGLLGAAGELPAMGLVQVRVVDDAQAERAREVIREWEAMKPGEDEAADESAAQPVPVSPDRRLPWFVLGAVLGAVVATLIVRSMQHTRELDADRDGVAEMKLTWDGDRLARGSWDYNHDGRTDQVHVYGSHPGNYLMTEDRDFDGRMEIETRYRSDMPESSAADFDGDGFSEYRASYSANLMLLETWSDPGTKQVTLRRHYTRGVQTTSEIDSDGDGRLDTVREHDSRGEIVSSRPM